MLDLTESVIVVIGQTAARHNLRVSYDDCVDVCMTDVHAEQSSVNALSEHGLTVTYAACVVCKAQREQFPAQQASGLPPLACWAGSCSCWALHTTRPAEVAVSSCFTESIDT